MTSEIKVNQIKKASGSTITIGESGDTITLASGASQSGFGRSGSVDWQTSSIKTSTFTATSGEGYFCDTSSSAFTVNLPAGSAGAIVSVSDYTRTFQTNSLTVQPNGSEKIGGIASGAILSTEGQAATFIYVDSTEGWINVQETSNSVTGNDNLSATGGTITTCGNFKIHTFTSPGTFTVAQASQTAADNVVSYMVVGGGGGGGGQGGGGAGAGGFRENKSSVDTYTASPLEGAADITVTAQAYPITVGAGGAGSASSKGSAGSASIFSTTTSAGGGEGGSRSASPKTGGNGGSGGGGGGGCGGSFGPGGTGNTPPVSPAQGTNGGSGGNNGSHQGGGGGGAGAAGSSVGPATDGNASGGTGGNGVATSITGSPVTRAGGGGGSGRTATSAPPGAGGSGGGGRGEGNPNVTVQSGTANTGGGGGGTEFLCNAGGSGGSGIVVIRYKFQ
tara:strand:+ start:186 stop:1529 length:1344 start_codon:yes stop_codon:yes gene_type:complete